VKKYKELEEILQAEIKPALGCTGPVGVAYAAAEARDAVGGTPVRIRVICDKELAARNEDVGIPGTKVLGLRMAAALGAFAGDPSKKLEVLRSVAPEDEERACAFSLTDACSVEPDWDTAPVGLYAEAIVETEKGVGRAIIAKAHNNLVLKEADGRVLYDAHFQRETDIDETNDPISRYTLEDLYSFATEAPVESLGLIKEALEKNRALAQAALDGKTGIGLGQNLLKRSGGDRIRKARAITAAGSEARMCGCGMPAMACATSGNAGVTGSMPLLSLAEDMGADEELLLRATALSYLVTILGKQRIGRHSVMCACVVAASEGVAAGTALLLGGGIREIHMAINNTIINVFGVVCDGPRPACALKLSSAAGIAIEGAMLAMEGFEVPLGSGVCGHDADESIRFMGDFAKTAMTEMGMKLCKALYGKHQK